MIVTKPPGHTTCATLSPDTNFQKPVNCCNQFVVNGHQVDIGKISKAAVMTVEGERDDISAPGQC